ncbi:MAG: 30S ribosomal protein S12 methylthiotransferase RimO [Firmicutes bacterium]|nr:30S ribosomal protein S12 methylthiotransferase RimO [Bacillota bacterium]
MLNQNRHFNSFAGEEGNILSKKAAVITLGCAKNSVDSEHIKGSLIKQGISLVENPGVADYIIVNTCGFIEAAKQESIDTILELVELKNRSNHKKIIVTGCLAQRYYYDLAKEIPEIDLLVGISNEFDIANMIKTDVFENIEPSAPRHDFTAYPERILSDLPYAYLQIADGCDNRCAYCAIPQIRGNFRSKPFEKVLDEAHFLDEKGAKEVNIIAQDTGRYGYDLYGKSRFVELLSAMRGFKNIKWIRLLYLQPHFINDELIDMIKSNRLILPYLDIPIQHASPRILHAMNRHGAGSDYLAQIAWLRRVIPDVVLRTTVIVGYPGETDNDFDELADFVQRAKFDYLGIFEYSPEEGTKAAELPNRIPDRIVKERYHQLNALQDYISQERNNSRVGKTFDVLIEREVETEAGLFEGRAWWQAPEVDGYTFVSGDLQPGQIIKTYFDGFDSCDFYGRSVGGAGKQNNNF